MDRDGEIVGAIEFFPFSHYMQGYELSYQLFGAEHAGKGYTSEAVNLLTEYLLGGKRVERIQLIIHPDNAPSRRIAEKCGFTLEGTMRRAWFHRGAFQDVEIWARLRGETPS